MDGPHRIFARAMIAQGWTLRRLSEELAKHAHSTGEPARAAHESQLSRIVNDRARPTRAQAVGIYAVLVGAPAPISWDAAYGPEANEPVPVPARPVPPMPRPPARGRRK